MSTVYIKKPYIICQKLKRIILSIIQLNFLLFNNLTEDKLPIGTEIYNIKDSSLVGIAAYINSKYIYCKEISEQMFYDNVY